jgi:hypothetical protein
MRFVGSVLVRNECVFVEQAVRNVADVCDRIHAVDHLSDDGTWEILQQLALEFDHLEVTRSARSTTSHDVLERYAGTPTWVLGVDGDELCDPAGLQRLRAELAAGAHADVFRLKAHVLNCDQLDVEGRTAGGWLAPPSRPITKLFNYAAVDAWPGGSEHLSDGRPAFREGFHWESKRDLSEETDWSSDPLRCLHVCFLPRTTGEVPGGRQNLNESRLFDRSIVGRLKRLARPPAQRDGSWKRDWYARGEHVTVDATPFLAHGASRPAGAPAP